MHSHEASQFVAKSRVGIMKTKTVNQLLVVAALLRLGLVESFAPGPGLLVRARPIPHKNLSTDFSIVRTEAAPTPKLRRSHIKSSQRYDLYSRLYHPSNAMSEQNIPTRNKLLPFLREARRLLAEGARKLRRGAVILSLAALLLLVPMKSASAIPSAGRMGGSFRSHGIAPSSISGGASYRGNHLGFSGEGPLPPSRLYTRENPYLDESGEIAAELSGVLVKQPASPSTKVAKVIDPVTYYCALTGAYGLGVYRINKMRWKPRATADTPLGSGASVLRVSVALDVSNRDDEACILSRLRDIASRTNTLERKGVQDMISEVALELLRQRESITSACSTYMHCNGPSHADIEFKRMSVFERAKFGKETVNVFNGAKVIEPSEAFSDEHNIGKATSAIVTLIVAIEGDRTQIPKIVSKRDLDNLLMRIAADSQIDNCLLSAEVLWSPDEREVTLSDQDLVASYPDLAVL